MFKRLVFVLVLLAGLLPWGSACFGRDVCVRSVGDERRIDLKHLDSSGPLCMSLSNMHVGSVGVFCEQHVLGYLDGYQSEKRSWRLVKFMVARIVDDRNLVAVLDKTHGFWFKGFIAEGIVDFDEIQVPYAVKVTGTKTYTTAKGEQRTVFVIEPHTMTKEELEAREKTEAKWVKKGKHSTAGPMTRAKEEARKEREDKLAAKKRAEQEQAAAEDPDFRTWTSAKGDRHVKAKFVSVDGNTVTMTRVDGSNVKVPLDVFSEEDRAWVEKHKK